MVPRGSATAAALDVTDAAAVQRLVDETASAHGRLDFLFNNAGVAVMGHAAQMGLDDWTRLVRINLLGVVHGITAAYPRMIRQGFGHIVNTASLAGLVPTPGATGYAMTKHAVVGLSTSLRGEAAAHGVRVSVVCPGVVDTPIKDATQWFGADRDETLASLPVRLYPPERCARDIAEGVRRNRAIIVVSAHARFAWAAYRLAPRLMVHLSTRFARRSALLKPPS
jgi:short-subunit dehydrogenase